jgi:hypothetical protein
MTKTKHSGRTGPVFWWAILACKTSTIGILAALVAGPALAEDAGRLTVMEENDSIVFPTDRYYTQGLGMNFLTGDVAGDSIWDAPFSGMESLGAFGTPDTSSSRRYAIQVIFGQSIFTPDRYRQRAIPTRTTGPMPAGCMAASAWVQDTDRRQARPSRIDGGHRRPRRPGTARAERLAPADWCRPMRKAGIISSTMNRVSC